MQLYIKDGVIRPANRIIVRKGDYQIINPTEEMIFEAGWEAYTPPAPSPYVPTRQELAVAYVARSLNSRTDVANDEALEFEQLVYSWNTYLGKSLKAGQIVAYEQKLYRVRQDIMTVVEGQEPSLSTSALYEVIDKEHAGTFEDPIPYSPPMEIFAGKYYIQSGVVYHCTRDSGQALTHDLAALVGIYVELVNN